MKRVVAQVLHLSSTTPDSTDAGEIRREELERAQAGDAAACVQLVRQYERRVFSLLGRMLGPRKLGQQVEDLAQETFLRVFRALGRFDPTRPAKLSTWILCIASRLAINAIERRVIPVDGLVDDIGSAPEQTTRVDARQTLERAIASLSAEQQAVLVLREFHGLDDAEIGDLLGLRPGAVRARICRARIRLRECMPQEDRP